MPPMAVVKYNGSAATKLVVNGVTAWLGGGQYHSHTFARVSQANSAATHTQNYAYPAPQKANSDGKFIYRVIWKHYYAAARGGGAININSSVKWISNGDQVAHWNIGTVHHGTAINAVGAQTQSGTMNEWGYSYGKAITHFELRTSLTMSEAGCSAYAEHTVRLFP